MEYRGRGSRSNGGWGRKDFGSLNAICEAFQIGGTNRTRNVKRIAKALIPIRSSNARTYSNYKTTKHTQRNFERLLSLS